MLCWLYGRFAWHWRWNNNNSNSILSVDFHGDCDKIALTVTFATGLAVIGLTMPNSCRKHKRNGLIVGQHLKIMMVFLFISTIIGAFISQYIDVGILKLIFGAICILSTIVLALIESQDNLDNMRRDSTSFIFIAILTGLISGLIGPAGAAIVIPIFILYLKYPITNTIGTSSVLSIPISLAGVLTYIVLGLGVKGLPEFSLGYVNLLQLLFLTITSIIVSGYAANLASKISVKKLKILQVIVISYIGLQMIGVFDFIFLIF